MDTGKCCDCGVETSLFVNGVPICVVCDAKREAKGAFPIPGHPRDRKKTEETQDHLRARFAAA
jgi:hypothetical protein